MSAATPAAQAGLSTGFDDPSLEDPVGWGQAQRADRATETGWASIALPLLSAGQEPVLGFWIEAGILAQERLDTQGQDLDPQDRADLNRVVTKGETAREHLIRANVRLVYYWVHRRTAGRNVGSLDTEDLVGEGMTGLVHAVQMWDYQMGLKFSTYASGWIRSRIGRAATGSALVSLSFTDRERLAALAGLRAEHQARAEPPPTSAQISARMGITQAAARDLMNMHQNTRSFLSLDQPSNPHETGRPVEVIDPAPTPDEVAASGDQARRVTAALHGLPARDRAIVCARVGWSDGRPATEAELAVRYGVSTTQIRAIAVRALATLRGDLTTSPQGWAA